MIRGKQPDVRVAELVAVEMKVGAADPHGLDAHDGLARHRRARIGSFVDLDAARCCRDGDLHREGAGAVGEEGDHLVGDEVGVLEVQGVSALGKDHERRRR